MNFEKKFAEIILKAQTIRKESCDRVQIWAETIEKEKKKEKKTSNTVLTMGDILRDALKRLKV